MDYTGLQLTARFLGFLPEFSAHVQEIGRPNGMIPKDSPLPIFSEGTSLVYFSYNYSWKRNTIESSSLVFLSIALSVGGKDIWLLSTPDVGYPQNQKQQAAEQDN